MRRLAAALTLVAFAVVVAPAGPGHVAAAAGKPAKLKKNQAWVAPDWDARAIRSIALTPPRSVERNVEAEALTRRMLESALADRAYRYVGSGSIFEALKRDAAEPAYRAAEGAFGGARAIDTTSAHRLHASLGADALLFTNLTNWQRYVVDEHTRGASFTQVAVDVVLYSLADGAIVWRGSFQEKGDGPYNEPQSADAPTRDPGANMVGGKAALEPPAFEEVVEKLMTRVVAALPKPAPKPAGGG